MEPQTRKRKIGIILVLATEEEHIKRACFTKRVTTKDSTCELHHISNSVGNIPATPLSLGEPHIPRVAEQGGASRAPSQADLKKMRGTRTGVGHGVFSRERRFSIRTSRGVHALRRFLE